MSWGSSSHQSNNTPSDRSTKKTKGQYFGERDGWINNEPKFRKPAETEGQYFGERDGWIKNDNRFKYKNNAQIDVPWRRRGGKGGRGKKANVWNKNYNNSNIPPPVEERRPTGWGDIPSSPKPNPENERIYTPPKHDNKGTKKPQTSPPASTGTLSGKGASSTTTSVSSSINSSSKGGSYQGISSEGSSIMSSKGTHSHDSNKGIISKGTKGEKGTPTKGTSSKGSETSEKGTSSSHKGLDTTKGTKGTKSPSTGEKGSKDGKSLASFSDSIEVPQQKGLKGYFDTSTQYIDYSLKGKYGKKFGMQLGKGGKSPPIAPVPDSPASKSITELSTPSEAAFLKTYDNRSDEDDDPNLFGEESELLQWVLSGKENHDLSFAELSNELPQLSIAVKVYVASDDYFDNLLQLIINCLYSGSHSSNESKQRCMEVISEGRLFCQFLLGALDEHDEGEACLQILCLAAMTEESGLDLKQLAAIFENLDEDFKQLEEYKELQRKAKEDHQEREFDWSEEDLTTYMALPDTQHTLTPESVCDSRTLLQTHKWMQLESFMNPLRTGLDQVRRGMGRKHNCDVNFYSTVTVTRVFEQFDCECIEMVFETTEHGWSSKVDSLKEGSLVCFSDDRFVENIIFSVVISDTPETTNNPSDGVLSVLFNVRVIEEADNCKPQAVGFTYDLIESKKSYIKHSQILNALQSTDPEDLTIDCFSGSFCVENERSLSEFFDSPFSHLDEVCLIEVNDEEDSFVEVLSNFVPGSVEEHQILLLFSSETTLEQWCQDQVHQENYYRLESSLNLQDLDELEEAGVVCATAEQLLLSGVYAIESLADRAVIVCEATEVPEAELLAVLPPRVRYLILLGNSNNTTTPPSTMERLVKNGSVTMKWTKK